MKLNVFNRTQKSRIYLLGFLLLSFACLLNSLCVFNAFGNELSLPQHQSVDERTKSNVLSAFGKIPLYFVANQGQLDLSVIYYAKSEDATVYCTEEGLVFGFAEGSIRLKFSQEKRVKPEARNELKGKVNYFTGNVPAMWRTNIPTFAEVVYPEVYLGIDLVYSGNQRRLKYTFYLHPGSEPNQIQMIYDGVEGVWVDELTGQLVIQTKCGEMRDAAPIAYQEIQSVRKAIDISFRLIGEKKVGFVVGDYDSNFMLVLDPGYSTYLGGSGWDHGTGIAVDSSGNAYVTGDIYSPDFPTKNPYQDSNAGRTDAFVTKLSSSGNTLIYSTYLGGSGYDSGGGIAVDSSGNAYVTGWTNSFDFPIKNPYQSSKDRGGSDAFVTKLSSNGNTLIYSTYLGGSEPDGGRSIALDSWGNAYVTGRTVSPNFPTQNPYQDSFGGGDSDAFVTKLSSNGNALIYSTYLGGSRWDEVQGIAVDSSGNAYLTGVTYSFDFPTQSPYQGSFAGWFDAFVTKLSSNGNTLIYSTYLGGSGDDYGYDIAVDSWGNVYLTGVTSSPDFPTQNPYQDSRTDIYDAFVASFLSDGALRPIITATVPTDGAILNTTRSHIIKMTGEQQSSKTYPMPLRFALLQNYPSPFNIETWLPYELASDTTVTIRIYNLKGQFVRQLDLGKQKAGSYIDKEKAAYWDGKDQTGKAVSSGLYFYTLKVGDFQSTKRMVVVK